MSRPHRATDARRELTRLGGSLALPLGASVNRYGLHRCDIVEHNGGSTDVVRAGFRRVSEIIPDLQRFSPDRGTVSGRTHQLEPWTVLRRACPRCGEGAIFASAMVMNERCPACGLEFGRGEPGYFTGAMYVSYAISIPLIALLTALEYLVFPNWTLFKLVLLAFGLCLPLIPMIWQYSRVIWIHFDRWVDP